MEQVAPRVLLAFLVLVLGACAAGGPADEVRKTAAGGSGADAVTTDAPPLTGLTASVYQTRLDVAAGQVEAQLTNGSGSGFTVRGLSLTSNGFEPPMDSVLSGILIGPGRVVDLPVPLGPAVCPGGQLEHQVLLDYELEDGRAGTVVVPAHDEGGRLADLHAAQCFSAEVDGVATLSVAGPPVERELGGVLVADLTVEVTPHGGPGSLELRWVRNTTLLQLLDPVTGERQPDGYDLTGAVSGPVSSGDLPRSVVLTVVPARCDAHAVAEDKQGTRLLVDVVLDERAGTVAVPAPPALTGALHDFVQRACERGQRP